MSRRRTRERVARQRWEQAKADDRQRSASRGGGVGARMAVASLTLSHQMMSRRWADARFRTRAYERAALTASLPWVHTLNPHRDPPDRHMGMLRQAAYFASARSAAVRAMMGPSQRWADLPFASNGTSHHQED